MKLSDIASVKTGLVLSRKQAKDKEKGIEYRLLNLKAVTNNCEINMNELIAYYAEEELPSNYLTQVGDVIIKTSEPYTAVYINEQYSGIVIPSHFVIVRVNTSKADPEYIAWYMNKDRIKKDFNMSCAGLLKQIKPTLVGETEINLPDLEKQKKVVGINNLAVKELKLLDEIRMKKEQYYKALINKINRM
jgi:restriction endonuclease S subunit